MYKSTKTFKIISFTVVFFVWKKERIHNMIQGKKKIGKNKNKIN